MSDPLDTKVTASLLYDLARQDHLDTQMLNEARSFAGYIPGRVDWQIFINRLLLALGTAFTLSGIFFFFAYNWADMNRFAKFGLIEGAIIIAVGVAWWKGLDTPIGRVALIMATLLVGTLLAVFGQVYQTGADSYTLFLTWALLVSGWVIIATSPILWLIWLVLLNLTWGFYATQMLASDQVAFVFNGFIALNLLGLVAAEIASFRLKGWQDIRWIQRLIAASVLIAATIPVLILIFEDGIRNSDPLLGLAPVIYVIVVGGAILAYATRVRDLLMLVMCALSLMVVITSGVARLIDLDCLSSIIISIVILLQAWLAVTLLRKLNAKWEQEYDQ